MGHRIDELYAWAPKVVERLKTAELTDVSTDREQGGLQANIAIDRAVASRLGVASGHRHRAQQRLCATPDLDHLRQRNQYRVVLEIDPGYQRIPPTSQHLRAGRRPQVPLNDVITRRPGPRRWSSTIRARSRP